MRFVPLRVSCPSPVRRLASSGGGPAWSLSPRAWLWVVCALAGVPVCPGRSGARGVGGGQSVCHPPSGALLGRPGRRGAGDRSASVCLSASIGQAPCALAFSRRCVRSGPPLASVHWRCRSHLRPSRALARVLCCALCPPIRCPHPGPPRVPVLPRCCCPWCPARALAPSHRCVRSGLCLASAPWRSLCRLPPLALYSRGRHPAPPHCRLLPLGPCAGRLAAAAAAAA